MPKETRIKVVAERDAKRRFTAITAGTKRLIRVTDAEAAERAKRTTAERLADPTGRSNRWKLEVKP